MPGCDVTKFRVQKICSNVIRFPHWAELLNPFLAKVPIFYPLQTTEKQRFSDVSGGIKWEHWPEIS